MLGYTDYFVVCTGNTERQTKAIHDGILRGLKDERSLTPRRVEGLGQARWILMDYLDVVVHIFTPDTREYYRLEQLWGEVPARAARRDLVEPSGSDAAHAAIARGWGSCWVIFLITALSLARVNVHSNGWAMVR